MHERLDLPAKDHELEQGFEYQILANAYERMNYVHLTDDLIARMDGTDGEAPDFVIFLDRSARPVNWFVRELWDTLAAKDENGNPPTRPQSLFVNIDARKHTDDSPAAIANLRAIYSVDTPADGGDMMQAPTHLDGKKILVVDEVSVSGDTLRTAGRYLSQAFPDAQISTHAWMPAQPERPDLLPTDNPRWYEKENGRYQSVTEHPTVAREAELKASDPRVARGWDWLSKIPTQQPEGAKQLMREIKAITQDIKSGKLPYLPSIRRPDEEARIQQFSGLEVDDFFSFVRWARQHYWPDYNIATNVTDKTGPLDEETAREYARLNHVARARRLGIRNPGRFDYTPDPRTPEAKAYSEQIGFAQSATAALAHHVRRT